MSSSRVGPTYDSLMVVIQPWPDRTSYSVKRVHFDGRVRSDTRIASGSLGLSPADLARITPVALLERVLEAMRDRAQPSAPPLGDMGDQ